MENNVGEPVWFGQYRLTSRVATGGMAEVYVGRHITDDGVYGPLVAVKRLLPHLAKDQSIGLIEPFPRQETSYVACPILRRQLAQELQDGAAVPR